MDRLLPAGMVFILLTIRCHQQPLLPKRIVERISHRLGQPALLCRDPSPTLLACSADYLSKPVDDEHLERCLRSALESGKPHEEYS